MKTRRGISADIIECDGFIDMPASAQALYIHLILACDDEGFTSKMRLCKIAAHASDDDEKILLAKGFIIQFRDEYKVVTVIKHWWMNNYLRSERVIPSEFAERALIYKKENGTYTTDEMKGIPLVENADGNQVSPKCHPPVNHVATTCQPSDTPTIHNNTKQYNSLHNNSLTNNTYQNNTGITKRKQAQEQEEELHCLYGKDDPAGDLPF